MLLHPLPPDSGCNPTEPRSEGSKPVRPRRALLPLPPLLRGTTHPFPEHGAPSGEAGPRFAWISRQESPSLHQDPGPEGEQVLPLSAASLWPRHSARVAPASPSHRQGVAIAAPQEVVEEEERGDVPSQPSTLGSMEGEPGLSTGGAPPLGPQGAWAITPLNFYPLPNRQTPGGGSMAAMLIPETSRVVCERNRDPDRTITPAGGLIL